MKPDSDFSGAVAEFIPFLDSCINKIIVDDDEDADESKSRKEDPDEDRA